MATHPFDHAATLRASGQLYLGIAGAYLSTPLLPAQLGLRGAYCLSSAAVFSGVTNAVGDESIPTLTAAVTAESAATSGIWFFGQQVRLGQPFFWAWEATKKMIVSPRQQASFFMGNLGPTLLSISSANMATSFLHEKLGVPEQGVWVPIYAAVSTMWLCAGRNETLFPGGGLRRCAAGGRAAFVRELVYAKLLRDMMDGPSKSTEI
jgi:hypothetical protein